MLPFLWCIAAVPWAGHVPYAFGHVPFLLVWMVAGVPVLMLGLYMLMRSPEAFAGAASDEGA